MKTFAHLTSLLALASLFACATAPERIPDHNLYADEAARLTSDGPLSFAVVGNMHAPAPILDKASGRMHDDGVSADIVADLRKQVDRQRISFVTLMGDSVRASGNKEWQTFDKAWREVLNGESVPTTEGYRVPVMPVVGDQEYIGDKDLKGMEGAFPGVGTDIGFNRVASWYHFDVRVEDTIWRFMVLDSNKKKLGSRWNEQMYWIPKATDGKYHNIVVFMHDPLVTLGQASEMNAEGAPLELLETVEDNTGLFKLRAVVSAEPHTTEVLLPNGREGTAYLTAGGGGAAAEGLERWGNASDINMGDVLLEPMFDLGLQGRFDKAAEDQEFPENIIDMAKGAGSWEGFTAAYDAGHFPLYGYWLFTITGEDLSATFRAWRPDHSFIDAYTLNYSPDRGWTPG